jgi:hypothetical protein
MTDKQEQDTAGVTLSAKTVIAIRDALVGGSIDEAYHLLYAAVDPDFVKLQPWDEIEASALTTS